MLNALTRPLALTLLLCGASFASQAGTGKCIATDKLYGGVVTASEALYDGDLQSVVDCQPKRGFATLPNHTGWFRVSLPARSCIQTLSMRPGMLPDGSVTLHLALEGAGGAVLHERTDQVEMANGVWHTQVLDQKVCGVKAVLFDTLASPSWVSWLDLRGH